MNSVSIFQTEEVKKKKRKRSKLKWRANSNPRLERFYANDPRLCALCAPLCLDCGCWMGWSGQQLGLLLSHLCDRQRLEGVIVEGWEALTRTAVSQRALCRAQSWRGGHDAERPPPSDGNGVHEDRFIFMCCCGSWTSGAVQNKPLCLALVRPKPLIKLTQLYVCFADKKHQAEKNWCASNSRSQSCSSGTTRTLRPCMTQALHLKISSPPHYFQ